MTTHPKHGKFRTPEYVAWRNAIVRCEDSGRSEYHRYGGRGIRVCAVWRHNFDAFLAHIGPRPSDQHTLDRIDVDGDYEPGNVRWATWTEQQRNRCDNRLITAFGRTMCLAEWALETGKKRETIARRLNIGFEAEEALLTKEPEPVLYEYRGERFAMKDLIKVTGVPWNSLKRRMDRHGSVEAAVEAWHKNKIGKKTRVA